MVTWNDKEIIAVIPRSFQLKRFNLIDNLINALSSKQKDAETSEVSEAEIDLLKKRFTDLDKKLKALQTEVITEKKERIERLNDVLKKGIIPNPEKVVKQMMDYIREQMGEQAKEKKAKSLTKKHKEKIKKEIEKLDAQVKRLEIESKQLIDYSVATIKDDFKFYKEALSRLRSLFILKVIRRDTLAAQGAIYSNDNYRNPVFSYVTGTGGDEDDFKATFNYGVAEINKKLRRRDKIDKSIGALLYIICIRSWIDELRKKKPASEDLEKAEKITIEAFYIEESDFKLEQYETALELLKEIKPIEKEMIIKRGLGFSWKEIVEHLPELKNPANAATKGNRAVNEIKKIAKDDHKLKNLLGGYLKSKDDKGKNNNNEEIVVGLEEKIDST